jgi:hypothetical protein
MFWYVGESRYASSIVSSLVSSGFVIDSSTYAIYNTTPAVVVSGVASIDSHTIYAEWTPASGGIYIAEFIYNIGLETFSSRQVIDVRETI